MQGAKVITGVSIAEAMEPRMTIEGFRDLLQDMRAAGQQMPVAILVSENDRRDLNQDLLSGSVEEVSKADQAPEHDGVAIGIVEGVPIRSHPDIPRGKARLLFPDPKLVPQKHPTAASKIISLGAQPAPVKLVVVA